MIREFMAAILAVSLLAASAAAQWTVESWENDLHTWDITCDGTQTMDAYQFIGETDPMYGSAVTDGAYAVALDLKSGESQGFCTGYAIDAPYVQSLSGATYLSLDVTSGQELSGYWRTGAGAFRLGLFIQGEVEVNGVMRPLGDYITGIPGTGYGYTFEYKTLNCAYSYDFMTETRSWDLTEGGTLNGLPEFFVEDGGWMQMRLLTNVSPEWGEPGWIIVDNLQAEYGWIGHHKGDFNGDGVVSGADYVLWANNFGGNDYDVFAWDSSNEDGVVNGADYVTWADHFGEIGPSHPGFGLSYIPEPATLALLAAGMAGALLRRHR